eukprot:gene12248-12385_t
MAGMLGPSPAESLQRFLEAEDLSLLEKPLVFDKAESFKSMQCCTGVAAALATAGLSAIFCPIGTFAPYTLFNNFGLKLDKDSVKVNTAINDCCFHVANTQKTVPLDKIQDVELQENCCLTCFGLKQVNVQTAGTGGPVPEIAAVFLASPERAREAIQLAVKLHKQQAGGAPVPHGGGAGISSLMQRLQCLDQLVSRNVLSKEEAEVIKVPVLAAEADPTRRLVEAADLLDRSLLAPQEFAALKARLISQISSNC